MLRMIRENLAIRITKRWMALVGAGLILVGFFLPALITPWGFGVLRSLDEALLHNDRMDLILAALRLVEMNSLRILPDYCGVFLLVEAAEVQWKGRDLWLVLAAAVFLLLFMIYRCIFLIHGVPYDFGLPAVMAAALVAVFDELDYKYVAVFKKLGLVSVGLIMLQFLDVMSVVSFLPVGRGEFSRAIKQVAVIMGWETELNAVMLCGFLVFGVVALIFFLLLRYENSIRELNALREQNAEIITRIREEEIQNRTYQEMQHLVHDLKSPLTVVQTLIGVFKFQCEQVPGSEETLSLLTRVENAVDNMSSMISEILYADHTSLTTVDKLVRRLSAQISIESYAPYIHIEAENPEAELLANSILFPRALANLIANSVHAIPKGRTPSITLRSDLVDGSVRFQVIDNGVGISPAKQEEIWARGYSCTGSSGLGLSFVRSVVDNMGGTIQLSSTVGGGTTITILVPGEGEQDGTGTETDHSVYR